MRDNLSTATTISQLTAYDDDPDPPFHFSVPAEYLVLSLFPLKQVLENNYLRPRLALHCCTALAREGDEKRAAVFSSPSASFAKPNPRKNIIMYFSSLTRANGAKTFAVMTRTRGIFPPFCCTLERKTEIVLLCGCSSIKNVFVTSHIFAQHQKV